MTLLNDSAIIAKAHYYQNATSKHVPKIETQGRNGLGQLKAIPMDVNCFYASSA